jgi:hypothetical protein
MNKQGQKMKIKIMAIAIISILLLTGSSGLLTAKSLKPENKETSLGLPDLVTKVEFFHIEENCYCIKQTISNKGTAIATDIQYKCRLNDLSTFMLLFLGVDAHWISKSGIITDLEPGESIKKYSLFAIDVSPGSSWCLNLGLIIDGVVDKGNNIKESKEFNNRDIVVWFLPCLTKPT